MLLSVSHNANDFVLQLLTASLGCSAFCKLAKYEISICLKTLGIQHLCSFYSDVNHCFALAFFYITLKTQIFFTKL